MATASTTRTDIRQIASRQHGAVAGDQLVLDGHSRAAIRALVDAGEFERVTRRVLRLAGAPETDEQRAMIAVLDAGSGAVLARESAVASWGAPGFHLSPYHVAHPRGGLRRDDTYGVVHTSRRMPPHHVTVLGGIPVTRPARSLFDLASTAHPLRVARAMDHLWANRLVSGDQLFAVHDELARRGRAGTAVFRELIEARGRDYVPPASNVEARFHSLLASDRQPPLRREVDLGRDEWVGRVDAHDAPFPLVFEILGDRWHRALVDDEADRTRRRRLGRAGFKVVEITEHEVWHEGPKVCATVWAERQAVRARVGAPRLLRSVAA